MLCFRLGFFLNPKVSVASELLLCRVEELRSYATCLGLGASVIRQRTATNVHGTSGPSSATDPDVPALTAFVQVICGDTYIRAKMIPTLFGGSHVLSHKTLVGGLILLLFVTNYYQFRSNSELKNRFSSHQAQSLEPTQLVARSCFDGKLLSHSTPVPDSIVRSVLSRTISTYGIVVVLNRIQCMNCYEFHRDQIRQLATKDTIPIFAVAAGDYLTLLTKDFPHIAILPQEEKRADAFSNRYPHAILLVDRTGRIVCSDISDQQRRDVGKMFYSVLRSFLS